VGHGPADPIDHDFFTASLPQCVLLEIQMLVGGRNPRIANPHGCHDPHVRKRMDNASMFTLFS
jgi:hypothetical protein